MSKAGQQGQEGQEGQADTTGQPRDGSTPSPDGGRDIQVSFLGGAGTVTGSRFLVETDGTRFLIDCGLYQGLKQLRLRNWAELPFDPESLDAVVLTHAHIDHSGFLPVLVREGFRGPIYTTAPTADLCAILLPDSGHIQEEDAAFANRKGFSKHKPAKPLYTEADASRVLPLIQPVRRGEDVVIGAATIRLRGAGHILGASSVEVVAGDGGRCRVLFSGDLGQDDDPICHPPEPPPAVGTIVMESTYGDRLHSRSNAEEVLAGLIEHVAGSGGTLLVPAFAVGRVQALLYRLDRLSASGRVPELPLIVDSPMASSVTELYRRHHDDHRLSSGDSDRIFGRARFARTAEDSRRVTEEEGPKIVISASGMLTGGRVLHHFKRVAPDPASVILLAGYQAPGTRGARLLAGEEAIKVHGSHVPVRARVELVDTFSAHADRQGLLDWLSSAESAPRRVVLVHGDPSASDVLRQSIEEKLSLPCEVAEHGHTMSFG